MMLSIVIPTKNEEGFLPRLLESIKRQQGVEYEVIVADAHSTDRTREIVTRSGGRVVDGGMPGVGRNCGAAVARGEYIAFFDADVLLPTTTYLADLVQEMHTRELVVATGRIRPESTRWLDGFFCHVYNAYAWLMMPLQPHAAGFCLFARRSAHEQIHGFDPDVVFAEDMDYIVRARRAGLRVGLLHVPPIRMSVRRFDRDGRWKTARQYIRTEFHMLFKGSIKKELFEYTMGSYTYDKKD